MTGAGAAQPRTFTPRISGWVAGLGAGALAALWVANDAGVAGASAVPVVARVAIATVAVFLVCGYAPAVLLTPARLSVWWPLLVLPLGAITSGMALTVLGFAAVPFHIALVLTLVAGIVAAALVDRPAAPDRAPLAGIAAVAFLIVALALVPTFRSGLATVTGFGSDAHLVVGSATFLQHNYPASTDVAYPADEVPPLWRSKFPIYYTLAAVSSVAGVEPWEALMTLSAILLALAALGFFLLTREGFRAPIGVAAAAMAVAVLDRRVFHLALHPYYNQLWGMLTLPFSILAAYLYAIEPSRRALGMFLAFLAVGAFAYPLMLPFPLITAAGAWWLAGHRPHLTRPSRRSLIWIVPLTLLLIVPIVGVVQKVWDAVTLLVNPGNSLIGWQGDLQHYPPVGEFFAIFPNALSGLMVLAVLILAFAGLLRAPRELGRPLMATLGAALAFAIYFRAVKYGQYFYFKVLSFAGPLLLVSAVAMMGRLRPRLLSVAVMAAMVTSAILSARSEIRSDYDQLTPETIELRDWAATLPAGASIRLDTPRAWQLWDAYMLSSHRLGSRDPITNYPHVPVSAGADYVLDRPLLPPPGGAVGKPIARNARYRLWRLQTDAPDTTSRRMVPTFSGNVAR